MMHVEILLVTGDRSRLRMDGHDLAAIAKTVVNAPNGAHVFTGDGNHPERIIFNQHIVQITRVEK